jgi:hypothetical protein
VAEGGAAYLAVSLKAEPDAKRTRTINGDIMIGPAPLRVRLIMFSRSFKGLRVVVS